MLVFLGNQNSLNRTFAIQNSFGYMFMIEGVVKTNRGQNTFKGHFGNIQVTNLNK